MGQQKEIGGVIESVKDILGYGVKAKKLKKTKTLKAFIHKMETRREDLARKLKKEDFKKSEEKTLRRNLTTLDKQIKKTYKILDDM